MPSLTSNTVALIIASLALAVIGSIVILLLTGIREDRRERDKQVSEDGSHEQYISDETLRKMISNMGMCKCGHDVPEHSFYGETRSECHGNDGDCECTYYEVNVPTFLNNYSQMRGGPMIPVQMSPEEIDVIISTLNGINGDRVHSLVIAYDPIDRAIKFKLNGGRWSPPFGEAQIDPL